MMESNIAYWEIPNVHAWKKKWSIWNSYWRYVVGHKKLLTLQKICQRHLWEASSMFNHWNMNTLFYFFPQSYISSADKQFVASTIQAIGRCASNISEVTDTCLAGLVRLLSNRDGKKGIPQFITYSYCHVLVKQRTHDSCLKEKDTEWILKRFNI